MKAPDDDSGWPAPAGVVGEGTVTVLSPDGRETDKTDKTDAISNDDFLRNIFGQLTDARPLLVSFDGNPANGARKRWLGRPWQEGGEEHVVLPVSTNNYFSLAAFMPDEGGRYRRQKACFDSLYAVMLDDIGTKVPLERLTLQPTWLLETSPGNYQAGYLLDEPLRDGGIADRLMNAIVAAGRCDPGANGPQSRLARLPVGVNGKLSPPFQCRLAEYFPRLRYSVRELVDGLQLEMASHERPKTRSVPIVQQDPDNVDAVWIPGPEENSVLVALIQRGLYKAPLGNGKHDLTCPWVEEHTGGADTGTAYFEPDDLWPIGGFKCLHGHCAERHVRDLLLVLGIEINAARMKPTIRVTAGDIHRVVDAAEHGLARSGHCYQRGGQIVTVVTDPSTRETSVQNISLPALVRELAGIASWERFDKRSDEWVRIDPPARHTTVLLESTSFNHLPALNGLARQPYLRPNGSLMSAAGYDPSTGMFGVFDAREFAIPGNPSRADAIAALALLKDLLAEFEFQSDSDMAAALSAILTAAVRPSLARAPMFHVRAHMVGSGKSYLCEVITAIATSQRGAPTTFPADDEECRKLLLAELLRAPAVIEFDNLTGDLIAHKSLCTALTSGYISGRILGSSKTAAVSTRALFLSSGNNVGPVQDMTRRVITINIDPGCEVPVERRFKRPDLVRELLQERGRYVSAVLTVVRAWIVAGSPRTDCRSMAGFSDWTDLCRHPLLWLGAADPALSVFEAMAEDPDREILDRLLITWQSVFGKTPAMVREAVRASAFDDAPRKELLEVLHDIAEERGEINRRKLGRWIKRHAGRIVNGRRFVRDSGSRSAEAWRVESVSSVLSVRDASQAESVSEAVDGTDAYARASRGE